jgi:hypothetical protein
MNDAVSGADAASGSRDPETAAAVEEAFGVHVQHGPPLAWLAAVAGLAAMALNQVLLPALNSAGKREALRELTRWGAFTANLAAIAALIAFSFGVLALVRYNTIVPLRRRLLLAMLSGIFLMVIALAVLFERQRTTAQLVLFAIGGAHVIGSVVSTSAFVAVRSGYARAMALLGATLASCALISQLLQMLAQVQLQLWQVQLQQAAAGVGEVSYLALLAGMARLTLPLRADTRSRVARVLAFVLLPVVLGALYTAERKLDNDFTLLLYHAQRVTLFIDSWPRLYAIPIALAVAASFAAAIGTDVIRKQAAAGVLLLLASGYTPHAPGRLMTAALALLLISRALIADSTRERSV